MRTVFVQGLLFFSLFLGVACSDKEAEKTELSSAPAKTPAVGADPRLGKNYLTDCKKLFAEARQMDSLLLKQMDIDKSLANKAIKAFTDFAYYCQSDSLSPVFLIKTAQVARVINNIPQAKLVLEKCIDTYPKFKNRPAALFLLAQLYDEPTYLNNEAEARKLYDQIILEYPKSEWALNAQGAIAFLGKSDAEIMQELKNKRKK